MGFRLYKDTVEFPCKLSGTTLYIGSPNYFKKYELPWLKFQGLEFDWQQNAVRSKDNFLRGKLYNKTFELLIDGDMEISIIHRESNLIIGNYKPERFVYEYFESYDKTDDFLDKRIGSYEMSLVLGLGTKTEQLVLETKARCFSNALKSVANGVANIGDDKEFSFLLVPSSFLKAQACLVVKTSDAEQIATLSKQLSPNDHILPLLRLYRGPNKRMWLQYENSDYSFEVLEYITSEYGKKVMRC